MSKKKGKKKVKEGSIEAVILRFLNILPDTFAWKNDSVGIYDSKRGVYRKKKKEFHINGVSDIIGIHRGRFMAIEVKTRTGVASDDQAMFIARIIREGGIAGIARSVSETRQLLAKADAEEGV